MIGEKLPEVLAQKLQAADWLRTAHRGAPQVAPGNSARALEAAAQIGVDLIEVDVHATRDGEIVLWHDNEMTDADGTERLIAHSSLRELQAIDIGDGQRVIDLAAAIEIVRGRAGLMIDLKADGLEVPITQIVRDLAFNPVIVCGGYWRSLREIRRLAPGIGTSLTLSGHWKTAYGIAHESQIDTDAVTVDGRLLEPGLIERLHAHGLAVLAWTIDRTEDMHACLDLGADGLTSNRPDLFGEVASVRTAKLETAQLEKPKLEVKS